MRLLCALATPLEFTALFPDLPVPEEHAALPLPALPGKRAGHCACITGVGPVNAALALSRILALHGEIEGVLSIGLAGSFDLARAPLGAVTLVTEEIFPEYGLAWDENTDARALGFAQWTGPGGPVFDRLPLADLSALGLPEPAGCVAGPSLTVAGVTAGPARAARLFERYAPLSENMEGFAVALACARAGLPCAGLRVISNKVGSRAEADRAFAAALAKLGAIGQDLFGA